MPAALVAVPGTNTIYATFQMSVNDERETEVSRSSFSYQRRGTKTRDKDWSWGWYPRARRMGFYQDPAAPVTGTGWDALTPNEWEPLSVDDGTQSQKFIMGTTKDSVGGTVSGAVVQVFRTSDDLYVGETTSDSNGRYEAGTPHAGLQHYLVAYRAGAPDIAGTTVNTLTPTNRDGT